MFRRGYIAFLGAISTAGCSGSNAAPSATPGSMPESPPTSTPVPTQTGSPSPEQSEVAAELVIDARETLNTATGEFRSGTEDFWAIPDAYDIDTRLVRDDLEVARTILKDAEEYATDTQLETIEVLRAYAENIEDVLGLVATLHGLHGAAERVEIYQRSERYDDAVAELEERPEIVDGGLAAIPPILETVDSAEGAIGDGPPIGIGSLREFLGDLEASLNGIHVLVRGGIPYLRGLRAHDLGMAATDEEEYDEAVRRFAEAIPLFEEAAEIFRAGEGNEDTGYQTNIIRETCRSEREADACRHYEAAVEAAAEGDYDRAVDEQSRGDEIWDRVCG